MNNLAGVQTSLFAALDTAPKTYPVYDAVPQLTVKPYLVIGEWTGQNGQQLGTMTTDAAVSIHAWSATAGKKQIHDMLDFVRTRLDGQAIAGTWLCEEDDVQIFEDPSSTAASRLYHGVARYLVFVEDGGVLPPLGQFDVEQFA